LEFARWRSLRGVENIKANEQGLNNETDASSMMKVMLSIAEGRAGSKEDCREMIEILTQQKFRAKIPAGIPAGIRVANKTGSISRIVYESLGANEAKKQERNAYEIEEGAR
jgi:beta-lactamase class A